MNGYLCSACQLRFEADAPRCPQCLRKSTVRVVAATSAPRATATATPGPRAARAALVTVIAALLGLVACGVTWLAVEQALLAVASRTVEGDVVTASMPDVSIGLARCDVDYRYVAGGVEHRGSALVSLACPESPRVAVRVCTLDDDLSDLGAGLGLVAFPGAALADFVAFAAVVVALQLLFPRSERLRRLAARVGSRYARAAG